MARQELLSSSFTDEWTHDVFLSFRGEDTRTNFISHLYNSLNQKGIHTFIDNVGLQRGEEITPALVNAIQESRIAIIVFSENYASSTFCLDELVNILDYVRGEGRLVWPVFCGVDPSELRQQHGSYGTALAKHEDRFRANPEKVRKWREALCVVANLSGWHFKDGRSQPEYEFISSIIEEVSKKINRTPLHVANHPVGLESSAQEVISLLELGSAERSIMVGIHGMGGVGKTTVALAVCNLIGDQFEGVCFLADIREMANKHGLLHLQETLLSEVVAENNLKLGNVHRGIPIIKRRLCRKKVLLILDDIDDLEQLQAIAGRPDWFGPGSRIIVTIRNKHLLTIHGVEKSYEMKELDTNKSLELLSWNAFKKNRVDPGYMDVLNRAVYYAGGLPLALEVIGSSLFGKSVEEWNSLLDKYERIPNRKVHDILKATYDSLKENGRETVTGEWTHDVFLSFRGEDTSTNFIGHLYKSLKQKGIHTLIDDAVLQRGDGINPDLVNAIQRSRIAIIVFSENYASSTFCLDELANILDYVRGEGRFVWPVFYGVDPSEVRQQRGSYGTALARHEDRFRAKPEKVRKWREALEVAANISGWHFQEGSQSEYEFLSGIIEEVSKEIIRAPYM